MKHFLPDYTSADFFLLTDPTLYTALTAAEAVLGLCLLTRALGGLEAYLAALVFACFTVIAAWFAATGNRSCGCLGALSVSPWLMLAVDAIILACLVVYLRVSPPAGQPRVGALAGIVLTIGGLGVLEAALPGGKAGLISWLAWRDCYLAPAVSELGTHRRDAVVETTLTVHNRSQETVTVVGVANDPVLILGDELPLTVPPGQVGHFRVSLRVRGQAGRNSMPVSVFFQDQGELVELTTRLTWTVRDE